MRLLADENFPGPAIRVLQSHGHGVLSAKELMRGSDDRAILERAQMENRVLLTFDKDFGELAFRFGLPATAGIVLFQLSGLTPDQDNARALVSRESRDDWTGHFAVVTDDRIRMRPLPRRE